MMRIILVLLATLVWGIASWWWYTCKIKGFCGSDVPTATISSKGVDKPSPPITVPEVPADSDSDGLSNEAEKALGLNPDSNDSDNDGLLDLIEVGGNVDLPVDSDSDGIIDALDNDDDNDTLLTFDEKSDANGDGNPDDAVDVDNDGLPNYLDIDSDGDGISDASEASLGLNPYSKDTDGDGITDDLEIGDDSNTPLDSDGDGVIDALDIEDNRSVENNKDQVRIDASGQSDVAQSKISSANIYFPFRSANPELSGEAEAYFDSVISVLQSQPEMHISLIGHTDNIGSEERNQELGMERAKMIQALLVKRGAPEGQIHISSDGERNPIASNEEQAGRDRNRRVELLPKN